MSQVAATISFVAAVPQFTVPDLVRTAEYYRDVLGFQIAGYWDGEQVSFATDPAPVLPLCGVTRSKCFSAGAISPKLGPGRPKVRLTSIFG